MGEGTEVHVADIVVGVDFEGVDFSAVTLAAVEVS